MDDTFKYTKNSLSSLIHQIFNMSVTILIDRVRDLSCFGHGTFWALDLCVHHFPPHFNANQFYIN